MGIRIVQAAAAKPCDVVICYHYDVAFDAKVKAAWPEACILNETYGPGGHYGGIGPGKVTPLFNALGLGGLTPADVRNLVLVGFSEGCQAPRSLLLAGAVPSAILAIDGIHNNKIEGSKEGQTLNYHVLPWKAFAEEAKDSRRAFTITHSSIVPSGYLSTTALAAMILAPEKELSAVSAGAANTPVLIGVYDKGLFEVRGYSGKDGSAHVYQAMVVLPAELARMRGKLLGRSFSFELGSNIMNADQGLYMGEKGEPITEPDVLPKPTPPTPKPSKPAPKPALKPVDPPDDIAKPASKAELAFGAVFIGGVCWWAFSDSL